MYKHIKYRVNKPDPITRSTDLEMGSEGPQGGAFASRVHWFTGSTGLLTGSPVHRFTGSPGITGSPVQAHHASIHRINGSAAQPGHSSVHPVDQPNPTTTQTKK